MRSSSDSDWVRHKVRDLFEFPDGYDQEIAELAEKTGTMVWRDFFERYWKEGR